jgi:hypothetical protein
MGNLGGIVKPVANLAQKASKASQIKKISLKVKFDPKKDAKKGDGA